MKEIAPKIENKETFKKEIITLEIEGKNYEVLKSHFTYPEYIQKENGGVEGYDRFEMSWDQIDMEKKKEVLDKISERLGIGTEMKDETISHYVNGAYGGDLEWNDNRFFLNKPFEIHDLFKHMRKSGASPYGHVRYGFIDRNSEDFDILKNLKDSGLSAENIESLYPKNNRISIDWEDFEKILADQANFIEILEKIAQDKDIVLCGAGSAGMSFAQGSHLSGKSGVQGGAGRGRYDEPFFNFNSKNSAFSNYLENIKLYKGEFASKIGGDLYIRTSGDQENHPALALVFTNKFSAFEWCYADTAYVPMKEGPNFFKFKSVEQK